MRRIWNAARKIAAGLPLGGEAVWPGLHNDLYVAHESIYSYVARLAGGCRVLDAACGTGYGSFLLANSGARSVVGIDREPRRISFASRRYRAPGLSFEVGDCERLSFPAGSFDLVVSSNTLEHLSSPARFLTGAGHALGRDGVILVAVPPVLSDADLREHGMNPDHVSNLSVRDWGELFEREGWHYKFISHRCRKPLDFRSYDVSAVEVGDFELIEEDLEAAYAAAPITALYQLRRVG
jgi:SAM-dependent methyltransferase